MDVANLRWGNKTTGTSLGRIKLQRFEQNSSLTLKPGGAGNVCVGAAGASSSSCASGGGRWEARGDQGLTVELKAAFADSSAASAGSDSQLDGARNRLTWENNRTVTNGKSVNGSGTQIIFDNFSTNDGLGNNSNDYGFQANLSIDVFETKVLKKTAAGAGDLGDEILYSDNNNPVSGQITYHKSSAVEANTVAGQALRDRRPLGFAVKGNVSFKEFNIGAVQLKHSSSPAQTVFSGVVMQNLNLTTNLTATPIQ